MCHSWSRSYSNIQPAYSLSVLWCQKMDWASFDLLGTVVACISCRHCSPNIIKTNRCTEQSSPTNPTSYRLGIFCVTALNCCYGRWWRCCCCGYWCWLICCFNDFVFQNQDIGSCVLLFSFGWKRNQNPGLLIVMGQWLARIMQILFTNLDLEESELSLPYCSRLLSF